MSNHAPKVDPISWLVFIASAVSILLAVFFLISSLINTVNSNSTKGELDNTMKVAAASDNLKPVGQSLTSDAKPAAPTAARSGKEVYTSTCAACHATGVAGAPKIDDKAAWEPRVATGIDALMNTAINGKGAMPARGGNPSVTDAELKATIAYMTKQAGFDLDIGAEPEAPAKKEETTPEAKAEEAPATENPATKEEAAPAPVAEEKPATTDGTTPTEPTTATEAPATPKEVVAPSAPEAPKAPEVVAPVAAAATAVVAEATSAAPSAADLEKGKAVYSKTCFACHATGVAGSPKLDDKAAWEPRIATGMDALYNTALHGKGAMPAKGGNVSLADEDVKAAVDYMVSEAK